MPLSDVLTALAVAIDQISSDPEEPRT